MSRDAKTKLIVAAGILLVFVSICFLIIKGRSSTTAPANTAISARVIVDNPTIFGGALTDDQLSGLNDIIYGKLLRDGIALQPLNHAVLRANSLKQTGDADAPAATFMVDLPSLKRSYRIEIDGNQETDFKGAYIFCPTKSELIYKATTCVDSNE